MAHIDFISNMVGEPGTNSKNLYTYIKSKKCDGSGVLPPKKDGVTYSDPADQAKMLNSQFAEAFTKEDCIFIPQMGPSLSNTAPPLIIQKRQSSRKRRITRIGTQTFCLGRMVFTRWELRVHMFF